MKIGRWEVRHNGDSWVSGKLVTWTSAKGEQKSKIENAKYHSKLEYLIPSLTDREVALLWPACQDIAEFRAKLKESADAILADLNTAFSSALDMPAEARQGGATPRSD